MSSSSGLATEIRSGLLLKGWCYVPTFSRHMQDDDLLTIACSLGHVHVPPGLSPASPLISTRPAAGADDSAPFDQPQSIGWHGDFSTHVDRPAFSLAYLAQADPAGQGAWRVASTEDVLRALRATPEGASVVRLLSESEFPYSFTLEDEPVFFRPLEPRPNGRLGLRFYGRALRHGARRAYGSVPAHIAHAIAAVESAADRVGHTLHAPAGALFVVDNWNALHDRLEQSVTPGVPLRRALLCFLSSLHEPPLSA